MTADEVKSYPAMPLYDALTLRTVFLDFENADWEKERADFHDTDVEVPAKLIVAGKTCEDVGVHLRGMSSFMLRRFVEPWEGGFVNGAGAVQSAPHGSGQHLGFVRFLKKVKPLAKWPVAGPEV